MNETQVVKYTVAEEPILIGKYFFYAASQF